MMMACANTPTIASTIGTGEWHLVKLGDRAITDSTITLQLTTGAQDALTVNGQGFCNSYHAPITVTGTTITIANIASTRRMCAEPQMNDERDYFAALQASTGVRVVDGTLVFTSAQGQTLLTFAQ